MIGTLMQDIRYGLRMLFKKPGFTLVAVLALALGIGANSAIFSVVNAVLLQSIPFKEPDRLMMVWENAAIHGFPRNMPAPASYLDWRDQNRVFEGMAAFGDQSFNLTGTGEPEKIEGQRVSASLFPLLGIEPALGRAFLPEEDEPGRDSVVILSHNLWQRRFGADPNVVGRTLTLDNRIVSVVGVMPQHFQFPSREDEVWMPMAFSEDEKSDRRNHYLRVIARLKPGVTLEQAQAEMDTIAARLQQEYPKTNTGIGVTLVTLHEEFVGDIRAALLILLGAVGFVLLIACANVANLLLARSAARQKEIAVRAALGASRLRLIRQLLTESVMLAATGGATGLLLAYWGVESLVSLIPQNLSRAQGVSLDGRVLGFTLLISLLTGVVFGLAPALQVSKPDLNETLKEGGRSSGGGAGRNRLRSLLVISEVALALVLLIGAGLMINSFLRLRNVDPGFNADNLLTMKMVLPPSKYATPEQRRAFYDQALERVQALPGVQSAGMITALPLTVKGFFLVFSVEGQPAPAEDVSLPQTVYRVTSPDYFRTMGIPLLKGRTFTAQDTQDSIPVVVVNQTLAERYWQGNDPIGKRIKVGPPDSQNPWVSIVGVVGDVKQIELSGGQKSEMYVPYHQDARSFIAPRDLVVRTASDPLGMAAAVRNEVWAVDKDQPVSNVQTMEQILSASVERQRFSMLLLAIFAALALLLAAIGIYGVISYSVTQRTHEIGIRMALGARGNDILKLVVGHGMILTLIGVALGLAAAFALTRLMSSLLFGITATDPLTFACVSLVLAVIALLASYIPARRAMRVDPMVALRYE